MSRPLPIILALVFFSVVLAGLLSQQLYQNEKLDSGPALSINELPVESAIPLSWPTLKDPQDQDVDSASLWGSLATPQLILFWASWCYPCWGELRSVEEARSELENLGLAVVPIGLAMSDEQWALAQEMWQDNKLSLPLYRDEQNFFTETLDIKRLPQALLLDSEGKVRVIFDGALPEQPEALVRLLKTQLEKL